MPKPSLLLINRFRSSDFPTVEEIQGTTVSYNEGSADIVLDIGCLYSDQSRELPPEKRGLVLTEPKGGRETLEGVCGGLSQLTCEESIQEAADYYQFVIYWWNDAVSHLPQFRHFLWGFSFLTSEQYGLRNRKFGVGGVVSPAKGSEWNCFPGYDIRHEILDREDEIDMPGMVYNYRKSWKGIEHDYPIPTKSPSFDWTHHLAIENCQENGYFTEKLLDCFLSYTVPLYYGDPTIADKFDIDGMIIVQSVDEILDVLANLTEDDYLKRMESLDRNFHLAKQHINPDKTLVKLVVEEWQKRVLP